MRAVPGGFLGEDAGAGDDDRDADGADDGREDSKGRETESGGEREPDGMGHMEAYVGPLLFGRDHRVREVRALLAVEAARDAAPDPLVPLLTPCIPVHRLGPRQQQLHSRFESDVSSQPWQHCSIRLQQRRLL